MEFPPVFLNSSDEAFLGSVRESLGENEEFSEFFAEIVLRDFPPETFLQKSEFVYDLIEKHKISDLISVRCLTNLTECLFSKVSTIAQEQPFVDSSLGPGIVSRLPPDQSHEPLNLEMFCLLVLKKGFKILKGEEESGAGTYLLCQCLRLAEFALTSEGLSRSGLLKNLLEDVLKEVSSLLTNEDEYKADVAFIITTILLLFVSPLKPGSQSSTIPGPSLPPPLFLNALRSYFVSHEPRSRHYMMKPLKVMRSFGLLPEKFFTDLGSVRTFPQSSAITWKDIEPILREPHLLCLALAAPNPRSAYQWIRLQLASTKAQATEPTERPAESEPAARHRSSEGEEEKLFKHLLLNRDVLYQMLIGSRHHDPQIRLLCLECLHLLLVKYRSDPALTSAMKHLLPYFQSLASSADETEIRREIVSLATAPLGPSSAMENISTGMLRFTLRCLFSKQDFIRFEASESLNFILAAEPDAHLKLPSVPLRVDANLVFDAFYPLIDLNDRSKIREGNWNEDSLALASRLIQVVLDPNETLLRYSSLSQLLKMITENGYQKNLISNDQAGLFVQLLHECLNFHPTTEVGLDFLPLLIGVVSETLKHDPGLCLELAVSAEIYFTLSRALLLYQNELSVFSSVSLVLCLLLFAETLVEVRDSSTVDSMIAVPQLIADSFKLSFQCGTIHQQSPYAATKVDTLTEEEQNTCATIAWKSPCITLSERMNNCLQKYEVCTTKENRKEWIQNIEMVFSLWKLQRLYFPPVEDVLLSPENWARITWNELTASLYSRIPYLAVGIRTTPEMLEQVSSKLLRTLMTGTPAGVTFMIRSLDIKRGTEFKDLIHLEAALQYLNNLIVSSYFKSKEMEGCLWKAMLAGIHYMKELLQSFHVTTSFMGRSITSQAVLGIVAMAHFASSIPSEEKTRISFFEEAFLEKNSLLWTKPLWESSDEALRKFGFSLLLVLTRLEAPRLRKSLCAVDLELWPMCFRLLKTRLVPYDLKAKATILLGYLLSYASTDVGRSSVPSGLSITREFTSELLSQLEAACAVSLGDFEPVSGRIGINTVFPLVLSQCCLVRDLCGIYPEEMEAALKESRLVRVLSGCLEQYPTHPGNGVVVQLLVKLCTDIDSHAAMMRGLSISANAAENLLECLPESRADTWVLLSLKPVFSRRILVVLQKSLEVSSESESALMFLASLLLPSTKDKALPDVTHIFPVLLKCWKSKPCRLTHQTLATVLVAFPELRQKVVVEHNLPSCILLYLKDCVAEKEVGRLKRKLNLKIDIGSLLLLLRSVFFETRVTERVPEIIQFPMLIKDVWSLKESSHVQLIKLLTSFSKNCRELVTYCQGWDVLLPVMLSCECCPILLCQVLAQLACSLEVRNMLLSGDSLARIFERVPLHSYLLLIYALSMFDDARSKLPTKLCFEDFVPILSEESAEGGGKERVEILALGFGILRNLAFSPRNKGMILYNEAALDILIKGLRSSDPAICLPALSTVWTLGSNRSRGKAALKKLNVMSILDDKEEALHEELICTLKTIFKNSGRPSKKY